MEGVGSASVKCQKGVADEDTRSGLVSGERLRLKDLLPLSFCPRSHGNWHAPREVDTFLDSYPPRSCREVTFFRLVLLGCKQTTLVVSSIQFKFVLVNFIIKKLLSSK